MEVRRIIDEQQDRRSANYHQWMTPEEFGTHFGVHDADIESVKAWLNSQGFTVESVGKSKRFIQFSGSIGEVEQAFQTEMHYFLMPNGETHVSNDRDISVPEALTPVIAGVPTLNNFFRRSHHTNFKTLSRARSGDGGQFNRVPRCEQPRQILLTRERPLIEQRSLQGEGRAHDGEHVGCHVAFDIDAETGADAEIERCLERRHPVPHLHLDGRRNRNVRPGVSDQFPCRCTQLGAMD